MDLSQYKLATRNMIMYPDLSVAGRLFGGKLLSWVDEGMAMLAMDAMNTQRIVTKTVSEVNFLAPALLGDILEIWGKEIKKGCTSYSMHGQVIVRRETEQGKQIVPICDCTIVFVALNEKGKPTSWQ
ncbi:MAG: hypothetical protein NE328_15780 [Lentisphaeraceae bacterium]|nr:hypothetical protein [Lentisphaeraceae bacterium]